jgi:predicted protein tyrosine phosphatase
MVLIITGYYETLDIFREIKYCPNLLSILDPGIDSLKPQLEQYTDNYLELRFDDIIKEKEGLIAPQKKHIDQIIIWAKNCLTQNALIHCGAGISRSTAASLITMVEWGYTYEEAVRTLKELKPFAYPNQLMLQLYGNQDLFEEVRLFGFYDY